ncbi:MAG: hypothetical protein PHD15_06940, partial [Clostridia bacterium]|nr:hypothetical protein [Clostridia bacterium]MDD4387465.1 hypothetical protein [Clostridia bacterium]
TYGLNLLNAAVQYKDLYTITTDSAVNNYNNSSDKKGDGIYETSSTSASSTSWFTDYSIMPATTRPFFAMGGLRTSTTSAGLFSFNKYTGASSTSYGFRPVLIVNTGL